MKLSKLKPVDLREIWQHEEYNFSKWLAEEEYIQELSTAIGIELTNIQTEAPSGRYSVDIISEEEGTGRKIIIENQLESTNHDYLGKIITYASGYDAEIIIWLVKDYKEEHKQAIDWLNENTDSKINFFQIRVELWQIENSPIAPKFNIISQPNDWAKALKENKQEGQLTDLKMMQLDYWNKFKSFAEERKTKLKLIRAQPQHWFDMSYGSSNSHISLTVNTQNDQLGCEIYIPNSKETYEYLKLQREGIEKEIGHKLEWMDLPDKKASRIKIVSNGDIQIYENWTKYFEWMKSTAELFQKVFSKYKFKEVNSGK